MWQSSRITCAVWLARTPSFCSLRPMRKPSFLLFFSSAGSDARHRKRHRLDTHGDAGASPVQLFVEDQLGQEVKALPAVLLGEECGRRQPEPVCLLYNVVWKLFGFVVVRRHRTDLLFRELVGQLADCLLFLSEREVERHSL